MLNLSRECWSIDNIWIERVQLGFGVLIGRTGILDVIVESKVMLHSLDSNSGLPTLPSLAFRNSRHSSLGRSFKRSVLMIFGVSATSQVLDPVIIPHSVDMVHLFRHKSIVVEPNKPMFKEQNLVDPYLSVSLVMPGSSLFPDLQPAPLDVPVQVPGFIKKFSAYLRCKLLDINVGSVHRMVLMRLNGGRLSICSALGLAHHTNTVGSFQHVC